MDESAHHALVNGGLHTRQAVLAACAMPVVGNHVQGAGSSSLGVLVLDVLGGASATLGVVCWAADRRIWKTSV